MCSLIQSISAEDDTYLIYDANSEYSESFSNYDEARNFYNKHTDEYDNLILKYNDDVLDMEYGIVEFIGDDGVVEYYSKKRQKNDYLCGRYGIDGAYLYSKNDNVYFVVGDDKGYTKKENVVLHPYEELNVSISLYQTSNNELYHNIKTQLNYEHFTSSICIDEMPSFMSNNQSYFSYDGHYFYDNFYSMIDDYNNDTFENAINEDSYYNYYQYLPHRSITNYSAEDIENYFYNTLGIDGRLIHYTDYNFDNAADEVNRSQIYGNINDFFVNQYLFGANALMLFSSSVIESSYGKSYDAFTQNNLYYNAAFDSPLESNNNRYNSISNSIYAHAKYYISDLYSNYLKNNYYGTHYGSKLSGITIENSLDYYYGEKAASTYYLLDKALGFKDKNSLAIGIIIDNDVIFYKNKELKNKLFALDNIAELSVVILEKGDDYYKIQIDPSFDSDYRYDFEKSIAYIKSDDLTFVFNVDNAHNYDFKTIYYDFNDGNYHGIDEMDIKVLEGVNLKIVPFKSNSDFIDYSISDDNVLIANYIEISNITVNSFNTLQQNIYPNIDLSDAFITIKYSNNKKNKKPITTDMIYINNDDEELIDINYNDFFVSKTLKYDEKSNMAYSNIASGIKEGDYELIKNNVPLCNYPFNMSDIRQIDYVLKEKNNRNYIINDKTNKHNISISGLDLSLEDRDSFIYIDDTYYVVVDNINKKAKNTIIDLASGYGFEDVDGINISFRFNYQKIDLVGPVIVQVDLDNKRDDLIYSVYHLNESGDVIKCRTTQSNNYIQFMAFESGDYEILKMPSQNKFEIDDNVEDLSYENMGYDNNRVNIEFLLGILVLIFSLIGILFYYIYIGHREKEWKGYKKSLQKVDIVQEEKPKN